MSLSDPLFNPTELRKLAQDNGPEYAGRSRRALRWCADVLEAADVVVQESRGDDVLIKQLVEALEVTASDVCQVAHHKKRDRHGNGDACPVQARHEAAITAGRARLEGKP